MRLWFTKARISAALDAGSKPSAWLRRSISGSDELRGFEQEMTALDRALKQTVPRPETPPSLHRSIMQAVQAANRPAPVRGEFALLRWLPVPALAVLVLLAIWWVARGPVRPAAKDMQSLAAATTALDLGGQIAQDVPAAVVMPLSNELERLNRDLNNTAQFVLASLP
jgi:hypothetical protein